MRRSPSLRSVSGSPSLLFALLAGCLLMACSAPENATEPEAARFGADIAEREADILRRATTLELFALDPEWPREGDLEDPAKFHGYGIRGQASVSDVATRARLLDLLGRACRDNDGMAAMCFNPRHGVRAAFDGDTVDLVICFECLSFKVYSGTQFVQNGDLAERFEPDVSALYRAARLTIAPR